MRYFIVCTDCDFRSAATDLDHALTIQYMHQETGHAVVLQENENDDEGD